MITTSYKLTVLEPIEMLHFGTGEKYIDLHALNRRLKAIINSRLIVPITIEQATHQGDDINNIKVSYATLSESQVFKMLHELKEKIT
jgi:hypothetical protein